MGGRVLARSAAPVWTTAHNPAQEREDNPHDRRQSVSATAGHAEEQTNPASRLGFEPGQVVQELGYDDDVDHELREGIEGITGEELADEEYDDVADGVILWFRDDDGDLTDALVDATSAIDEGAQIWLMTPKTGRDGHVEPSDIGEAAQTAGLAQTSSVNVSKDWTASRLVTPKTAKAGKR
jgi:hypothetical protein